MIRILAFILFIFALSGYADEKKALKLLEKGDYQKLIETLEKEIEKDTLNPGLFYIYSLLYDDQNFADQNLDTAYVYALKALNLYPPSEQKDREKLNKLNITDSTIKGHKELLDFKTYQRTKETHTLEGYNFYIENFTFSVYHPNAIADRNALAYQLAQEEDTYHAYFSFMENYPDAADYRNAKERYETLLFQSQTKDGSLKSFRLFLQENPDSPFRDKAIEGIYRISTCSNSEDSYLQFIKEFPHSEWVGKAIDRLYHNHREAGGTDFTYDYDFLPLSDSIKKIDAYDDAYLIPVFENKKYGFISSRGEMIIPYSYEHIDDTYLCGNITYDFLRVRNEGRQLIISKHGHTIYDGPYNDVQDLASGLLKILNNGKYGVIFKTGEEILPLKYEDVEKLDGQIIKVRQHDHWYLYSVNGLQLLPFACEAIELEGAFLLIKKDGKWAVSNKKYLFQSYIEGNSEFDFRYDDYELIEHTQILCFNGNKEGILHSDLQFQLPLEEQNIFTLPDGWLIRKDSIYHLYDDAFVKISGTNGLQEVSSKGRWITGRSNDKWILYYDFAPFPDVFAYDSVRILSENYVLAIDQENSFLIFPNYKKVKLENYSDIRIIRSSAIKEQEESTVDFLFIENDRKRGEIFGIDGHPVMKVNNNDIQLLGEEYFKTRDRGKEGLSDTSGQVLLKPQFDAIANYDNGYVSLLSNRKFGIYNRRQGLYLKPEYDRIIKPFNPQYLIANKGGEYGLIDTEGKKITDFTFKEILYWNDTSLLGKIEDKWVIMDILSEEFSLDEIRDFDFLNEGSEKLILFRKGEQFGIVSNQEGLIISPTFNDILNIGSEIEPIYFTEKYVSEAEFYIVIYYNSKGEIIRKQVFTDEEYDMIYCN